LHDRRLEQRCRRVGVVFEQLWRGIAVVDQIETTIDRGFAALPALADQPADFGIDAE
jgi:hypothetical protein